MDARVRALETLLVGRGLVDPEALDGIIETYASMRSVHIAGRRSSSRALGGSGLPRLAVARRDGRGRVAGICRSRWRASRRRREHSRHPQPRRLHIVLLLSLVGPRPPVWYKSPAYRARRSAIRGGARRLRRHPARNDAIRVWDRPRGALSRSPATSRRNRRPTEAELAALVGRDAMIGTRLAGVGRERQRAWTWAGCTVSETHPEADEPVFHAGLGGAGPRPHAGDWVARRLEYRPVPVCP